MSSSKVQLCSVVLNTKSGTRLVIKVPYPPAETLEYAKVTYWLTEHRYPALFWNRFETVGLQETVTAEAAYVYAEKAAGE